MFDHVEFSVSDIATTRRIYSAILIKLGIEEAFFDGGIGELGYEKDNIVRLLITQGEATRPTLHLCFEARSSTEVTRAYEAAINAGATDNGVPGYRENYGAGYFAAFVFDDDGHNIEMLYRDASAQSE